MMERKIKYGTIAGVCALSMIGLNSCMKMDETYDLEKDIDMTITVGGNLTIPGSDTEKMLLKDLLDLEEDGVIVANATTGDYHLIQDGEKNTTAVNVPGVDIDVSNSGFGSFNTTIYGISGTLPNPIVKPFNDEISIEISKNEIPEELVELSHASTKMENTYLVLSQRSGADVKLNKGYTITFPDYMEIEYPIGDGAWEVTGEEGKKNVLKLVSEDGFPINTYSTINFRIVGITFENENVKTSNNAIFNGAIHKIGINGNIKLEGKLSASGTVNTNGITISGKVSSQNIILSDVTGIVSPKVNIDKTSINLDDMPDVLTDNEVTLDLTDPRIYVTLTNPTPVKVKIGGTLTSIKGDNPNNKNSVDIEPFEIPANQEEDYVVCINQIKDVPEGGINYVKVENLSSIIKNIPDQIEMEITANAVEENMTVDLNQEYTIKTDYKIDTPLKFGKDTKITYSETIDGWDADLEDAEFESIEVSMTVVNEIPLGINLQAEAIDKNGNKLNNVEVDMNANIQAGAMGNAARQDVTFNITTTDGTINGLDGIKLNIVANAEGQTGEAALNENQSIQIIGLKLKLQGGITMDLN